MSNPGLVAQYTQVITGLNEVLTEEKKNLAVTQQDIFQKVFIRGNLQQQLANTTDPVQRAAITQDLDQINSSITSLRNVESQQLASINSTTSSINFAETNLQAAQGAPQGTLNDPNTLPVSPPVGQDPLPGATSATTGQVSPGGPVVSAPLVPQNDPNATARQTPGLPVNGTTGPIDISGNPSTTYYDASTGITTTITPLTPEKAQYSTPQQVLQGAGSQDALLPPPDLNVRPSAPPPFVLNPTSSAGVPQAAPAPNPQPQAQPQPVDPADDGTTDGIQAVIDDRAARDSILEAEAERNRIYGSVNRARESGNLREIKPTSGDWRFRITLAKDNAKYLYNAPEPGILKPLQGKGVIFPYVPQITVPYTASYEATDITHSNYKIYNYRGSSVDQITIAADFTAQDTYEANYLLAVIHFFRSVTKMFYGQDKEPRAGIPPPLCFLHGFGVYQFDNHPVVIQNFTYTFPNDVDYIAAGDVSSGESYLYGGSNAGVQQGKIPQNNSILSRLRTLTGTGLAPGGVRPKPQFTGPNFNLLNGGRGGVTMVPTRVNIQLTCLPIVTRRALSNKFSLKDYANGSLLKGSKNTPFGGLW